MKVNAVPGCTDRHRSMFSFGLDCWGYTLERYKAVQGVWYIWKVVLLQVEFGGGFVQLRKERSLRRCDNIQGDILSLCTRGQKGKLSSHCMSRPTSLCLSVYLWE